jgi:hypothetical protein
MVKLKILNISRDFSKRTERHPYYLSQELSQLTELVLWSEPGDIQDILNHIKFRPDFILLNDILEHRCPTITGLSSLKIPFGVFMYDLHQIVQERITFIEQNNVKYIFTLCRDYFVNRYTKYAERLRWLPHFANTEIFKDYGLPKDIDCLMMGVARRYYPLRKIMYEALKDKPFFVYHPHPGYGNPDETRADIFIGKKYAMEINRAKIFLTCDSTFHYPLAKYFEVPASNTLLLAPPLKELEDLGFIPDVHFASINEGNFLEKIEFYLSHHEEREKMKNEGYRMVHTKHSAAVRALELVKMIEDIIGTHH